MSTQLETMQYILEYLHPRSVFTARRMFGEYALYANGKVVGFVCDDTLYVKITPESTQQLDDTCEQRAPYIGAKLHYIVDESGLQAVSGISRLLVGMARAMSKKNLNL